MSEQIKRQHSEDSLPEAPHKLSSSDNNHSEHQSPHKSPVGSPGFHAGDQFLLPSPIPTRRNRTLSVSERAARGPTFSGTVKQFCRQKGYGLITPSDGSEPIFVHVSDVDGEFVPREGDDVTFKKCLLPPKNEKFSAVHVKITHMAEGTHEKWEAFNAHGTP